MAILYGHVGQVLYSSDGDYPVRLTNRGSLVVQASGGDYSDAVDRGRVFVSADQVAAAAGAAIPIYSTVTPVANVIWNPAGSGVKVKLISYNIEQVSGNPVVTPIFLMRRSGAGAEIATAATFSAFAKTVPVNAMPGAGYPSLVYSSNAGTCTLTTAGAITDVFYDMFGLPAVTANAIAFTQLHHEFNGKITIMPGTVIWVAGTVASVALYRQTWMWEEVLL